MVKRRKNFLILVGFEKKHSVLLGKYRRRQGAVQFSQGLDRPAPAVQRIAVNTLQIKQGDFRQCGIRLPQQEMGGVEILLIHAAGMHFSGITGDGAQDVASLLFIFRPLQGGRILQNNILQGNQGEKVPGDQKGIRLEKGGEPHAGRHRRSRCQTMLAETAVIEKFFYSFTSSIRRPQDAMQPLPQAQALAMFLDVEKGDAAGILIFIRVRIRRAWKFYPHDASFPFFFNHLAVGKGPDGVKGGAARLLQKSLIAFVDEQKFRCPV